jgi:hypothetical protein|tara:strand:- start:311 stop:433 length:123 start_codon:yes stop_codon:yes gene_type:complete
MEDLKTMVFINKQEENWRFFVDKQNRNRKQTGGFYANKQT